MDSTILVMKLRCVNVNDYGTHRYVTFKAFDPIANSEWAKGELDLPQAELTIRLTNPHAFYSFTPGNDYFFPVEHS